MGILNHKEENKIPFKKEQISYNRSENFGWVVALIFIVFMIGISVWAVFYWRN